MMTLDLTFQVAPLFWGMMAILATSSIAIIVLSVSATLSARRKPSSRHLIHLQPRAKTSTDSLRSAA